MKAEHYQTCHCRHEPIDADCSMSPEEFLNRNFGPGTWARDPIDDIYIVADYNHRGPGRAYILIDRDLRRRPAVIPSNLVN